MKECSARYSPDGSYIIHKDDCEAAKVKGWPTESNPDDNGTTRISSAGTFVYLVQSLGEFFTPTMQLRFAVYHEGPKLQQAWQGSNGTVEWRSVPTVEVSLEEYYL